MKLRIWPLAALVACLMAAGAAPLHAYDDEPAAESQEEAEAPIEPTEQSELESYGAYEAAPVGVTSGGGYSGGVGGAGLFGRPMQVIFGAEYIYAQATFSEALAFIEQDPVAGTETWNNIDFDYGSSYSFYGGVYVPDCGGALIFDYTRLTSDGSFEAAETGFNEIFGPFEMDDIIRGSAEVELNSYDLGFAKTIPLGCLQTCNSGCADGCDSGCGCGWCPAWDITWSGGLRYADVGWTNSISQVATPGAAAVLDNATTTLDFNGLGGRIGIMGRRYIGKRGLTSLYGKGDISVLFGDVDINTAVTRTGVGTVNIRTSKDITVPVPEVELGGSIHLGNHATLSAGYFWAAWHDLGMSQTYDFEAPGGANRFQLEMYDDANILGWNGFFARAEVAF